MRFLFVILFFFSITGLCAQQLLNDATKMANTVLEYFPSEKMSQMNWSYEQGVVYKGLEATWKATGNAHYFNYVDSCINKYIDANGNINYDAAKFSLDDILNGRALLLLYKVTGNKNYLKAIQQLRRQLTNQPRNDKNGFWHKAIYPNQMWLDGLYMAAPFYAEYANYFHEDTAFNDIAKQFALCQQYMRDAASGLLYHGWDVSKKEQWANKQTGLSQHFWARAMGWYGMALVDVLDFFPKENVHRKELVNYLKQYVEAIAKTQDTSGLWWNIMNMPNKQGNYLEASASCMFVYTIAKAIRNNYVDESYQTLAEKGFQAIVNRFVKNNDDGSVTFSGTVSVSGLGGKPDKYRDGSYEYYASEKVKDNDLKGIGAFMLAANEAAKLQQRHIGKGKKVLLDSYYNNETMPDENGETRSYHYKWEEEDNNGYSFWGNIFRGFGAEISTDYEQPSVKKLQQASVYIIVDPDIPQENPHPKYMTEKDAEVIFQWVKAGGTLVIMENDSGNADIKYMNILANKFGFTFNNNSFNHVPGKTFDSGAVYIEANNPVFHRASKIYVKDVSTIATTLATPVLQKYGNTIAVIVNAGKGRVFAVGDPWFYNEYTDGRKLPPSFQNFEAMQDLTRWLLLEKK
ncbi:MAG: glycoside hydrolase family 88 protein [Chitinophagaceae bacterium]|jgi:unsaturated rhamnogalacturonyl hydrolase|nr:glycoside hydrolase family 88 protein [Chitinophagaceae bacterium]